MQPIAAYNFSVDTFYMMSAFLSGYLMLEHLHKTKSHHDTSFSFGSWTGLIYLHRYLRLTPVYFVVIMFYTYLLPQLSQAPLWDTTTV